MEGMGRNEEGGNVWRKGGNIYRIVVLEVSGEENLSWGAACWEYYQTLGADRHWHIRVRVT